jgi:PAS domain S-box-containing protein
MRLAGVKINICFWYLDASLTKTIVQYLKENKYDPVYCSCKDTEALTKSLKEGSRDLIIADFDVPDRVRDSIEHLHSQIAADVPFIYIVGEKNEPYAAESLKRGVWDYILKTHLTKLVPTIYSSQKYRKVLKYSRQVEEDRDRKEELSRILIDYSHDPILILDKDWNILFANARAAGRIGSSDSDVSQVVKQIKSMAVDGQGNPHAELIALLNKERPLKDEQLYVGFTRDGEPTRYGFLQIQRIDAPELSDQFIVITFRDTTELLKAEIELVESESKYMAIFNAVPDGVALLDPETFEVQEVNKRIGDMFDFDKARSIEKNIRKWTVKEAGYDSEALSRAAKKLTDDTPVSYVHLSRSLTGREFWTENSFSQFTIDQKKHIILVVRDIQDERSMEHSLRESREHFKNLAENSPDVIMRFDRDHRHLYVNETVEDQLGIPVDRFIDRSHAEMELFPDHMVEFWEKAMDRVFKSGKPDTLEFDIENSSGEVISFEWRILPERNESGEINTLLTIARNITESRKAARAIEESEERLKLALEATSLGMWDWDLVTSEVYFSPIYLSMLGYAPEELPHELETWLSLLHDDDRDQAVEQTYRSIDQKEEGFEIEFRMKCKNGAYKWINSRGRAVKFDEKGNTIRLSGTHEDISERKRNDTIQQTVFNIGNAVNNTRNLDELYEKIREYLGEVIDTTNCFLAIYNEENKTISLPFLRDEKDSFTDFPAGKTLTGYVIDTGQTQLIDAEKEKQLTDEGLIEMVGSPCVSWLGVPLRLDNKIIGVFVVQSYDEETLYTNEDVKILEFVSDQIAVAIERKRDQDNIRENQEKQRRIFESSPDPIIVVDPKGFVTDYNTAMLEILNITNEKVIGQKIFHFINPRDWRKALTNFEKTWEEGYIKNLEFRLFRADRSPFEAEVSTGAIYNNEGDPEYMVIIFKNIDERKLYERNLQEAKEKAEESDRLKTAFLSNMSHEIRTPMNAIVGFSDLLNDPDIPGKQKSEFIAQINIGAENLMHLIDDIIDIAKIEAGQITINPSRVQLSDLVNEQLLMFRQNMERHDKAHVDLRLSWKWPESDLVFRTDPFRLKQIITNLLSNAIKFTEKGSIELGVEQSGSRLRIYVKDSGIGISEEKQSIIFDRFMQGHDSKAKLYGGTGLGLAISKNLTELLGGEIGVISSPGSGAEFWITLPVEELGRSASGDKEQKENTVSWKGKKILVAEDDTSNYRLISELLKESGIELIWARDGKETLELYSRHADEIDLVLMDIRMPEINGYECTKEIKKHNPSIPVIAQTAYAMSAEHALSENAGCDAYISKPLKMKELIKIIDRHIK